MSFLASVGRARPSKNIADVLNTKLNIEQGERRERLVSAQTALSAESLRQLQRKGEWEEEQHGKDNTPIALNTLAVHFPGGEDGEAYKMSVNLAKSLGHVQTLAGQEIITAKGAREVFEQMSQEPFGSKFIAAEVNFYDKQLREINYLNII